MVKLKDQDIKNLLERELLLALASVGKTKKKYLVKRVGRVNAYPSMSFGYYIFVQNFENYYLAKKSKCESYVRYRFRCIKFKNQKDPRFEVTKWTPSREKTDNDYFIYRSDSKNSDGKFRERLVTAINFVEMDMSPVPPN
jgi:hypothetical protein